MEFHTPSLQFAMGLACPLGGPTFCEEWCMASWLLRNCVSYKLLVVLCTGWWQVPCFFPCSWWISVLSLVFVSYLSPCLWPIWDSRNLRYTLSRVYKKHGFSTAMKPCITLRRMMVHPKDKWDPLQTADSVYEIPCKSCSKTYIGETGCIFKTRLSEHQKEAEKQSAKNFTRSQRKTSSSEIFKLAITEHVVTNNHIINWDAARIIDQECDKKLQNHTLAERSHLDQKQGQRHYEQGRGGIQTGQNLWPDHP